MMNLTIWSDFACPYCYIGETRLNRAIEQMGLTDQVVIDYKAYELDPTAPKEVTTTTPERFACKYGLTIEGAKQQIEQISQLGRELGIDFNYVTANYSNTRDAHRLMKLAETRYDRPTTQRLNEALFHAYFVENRVLSDRDVLLSIATGAGLKDTDVMEVLDSQIYDDEVRLDEREAAMRGIRGVPYIVFNGQFAVPGAMSEEGFRMALQREITRQEKDQEQHSDGERPHQCGPEGCIL